MKNNQKQWRLFYDMAPLGYQALDEDGNFIEVNPAGWKHLDIHGIVKKYGGDIIVESELGRGTTFNVYFPKVDADIEPVKEIAAELPGGKERILFIDDERIIRLSVFRTRHIVVDSVFISRVSRSPE